MKKTLLLSLSLSSSFLNAEDNGFFISAGYQIGEATQIVKSTGELKRLSDAYENLNNLANQFYTLNNLIQQSSNPTAINNARNNLGSSSRNLLNEKTNSPAYQAVLLALNAAVGLWQVTSYAFTACGPGEKENENGGIQTFHNVPGQNTTTITCNSYYQPGHGGPISTENYAKINKAYQIIQKALTANGATNGDGVPVLSNTTTKLDFTINGDTRTGGKPNLREKFSWSHGKYIHTQWIDTKLTQTTENINTTNSAQELLTQASIIITTLNKACPNFQNGGSGYWQGISGNGTMCGMFANEISAIQGMIANAQDLVAQSKIVSENTQSQINTTNGKVFNPFTDASFAQSMLANAKAQAEILNQAEQVVKNFERFPKNFVSDSLGVCYEVQGGERRGTNPGQTTSNTWGAGCAYVGQTITNLKNSIAYFGDQAQQIKHAQDLAYTLANFSSEYAKLGDNYQAITKALPNFPNALSSLIASKTDQNAPNGIKTTYTPDLNALNQLQTITQELGRNPFRKVGMIASSTTNNGAMNGIGFQVGYKQFFGQKKTWGARYYGFLDYNHTYIKSSFFNSASDVFTYGVGTDILYNFINDKATKNSKISFGLFGGIALAGASWLNSQFVNLASFNNYYKAKVNVASFQFLFNAGLRMNLAKNKKKANDHAAQHGVELGVKIPTINTSYYSLKGTQLEYRRLYSVYLNYVFAY
ncbi:SabA family sialic acid-binding adhesin [Helicobacter pylori]|uniref:Hop family adhesin SabA n=1 Tax=Helicobacter pylori TaxID=210 RepID=UPI00165B7ED1|nr:SabA family sialic acid-binding adhesin [Helicobacter pylori]